MIALTAVLLLLGCAGVCTAAVGAVSPGAHWAARVVLIGAVAAFAVAIALAVSGNVG